jgi:hypothetical protein
MFVAELMPAKLNSDGPEPSSESTAFVPLDPSAKEDQLTNMNFETVSPSIGEKAMVIVQVAAEARAFGDLGQVSDTRLNGALDVVKIELT